MKISKVVWLFAAIFLLASESSFVVSLAEENFKDEHAKPNISLNAHLSPEQLEEVSNVAFIKQLASFILTGSYGGQEVDTSAYDDISIDGILNFALQYVAEPGAQFYDNWGEILGEAVIIIDRLRDNGTDAVTFKDFKGILTLKNAQLLGALYWMSNKDSLRANYETYMREEFLGGIKNPKCKYHAGLWFDDAAKGKFWAFQMFDATAKIPTGILGGNINWVGSHKQCNAITNKDYYPEIRGRYCRAKLGVPLDQFDGLDDLPLPPDTGLTAGICISRECDNEDVASILSNSLKLLTVFKLTYVNEVECDEYDAKIEGWFLFFYILIGVIVAFVLLSTLYDIVFNIMEALGKPDEPELDTPDIIQAKTAIAGSDVIVSAKKPVVKADKSSKKGSKLHQLFVGCSLYTNSIKFFRTDNGGKITCLNGMRVCSMVWIVFGHTFNYLGDRSQFFLIDNLIDLADLSKEFYSQTILNAMYAVDTFFLMSGFLVSLSLLNKFEKSGSMKLGEWVYYYVHRYWRLAPPFLITVVFYNAIMPFWGFGPLWGRDNYPPSTEECQQYWWGFALFINNFLPGWDGMSCMGYLWYIPNDYQFYAVTPLFLVTLYKFPAAGKTITVFALAASLSSLAFLTANVYESRNKNIILTLVDMWGDVYVKPYTRAAPWLIGILLGYVFFLNKKVKMSRTVVTLGWLMATCFMLISIFGGFTNHADDSRRMTTAEYGAFFSLSRLTWGFGISWIIFACHYGYGGPVNSFLSIKAFVPITRLCYCAYLIHPTVMNFYNFQQQALFHATMLTLVYSALGHIMVAFVSGFLFSMFFEVPFFAIEKLVMG